MATAILYRTNHGTTYKVSKLVKSELTDSFVELINVAKVSKVNFNLYDTIIIGGSIHGGKIQSELIKFMRKNEEELMQKELGLFLCCMEVGEKAKEQFEANFPEKLRNHAKAIATLGGEFLVDKMNFIEKILVKKITGMLKTVSKINEEALRLFVIKMNSKE
jgi:menaquinone-dependent protoporphyrinogen oxidase